MNHNNSKKAYQTVRDLTKPKQSKTNTVQDKNGKCLTEEQDILKRWTEYCSELYNHQTTGNLEVLWNNEFATVDTLPPILRDEVIWAVKSLKTRKSAGVDNIPAENIQAGGDIMIDTLTTICDRIWRSGIWPKTWTQSLVITLPKKGNFQLCQIYRTISLISHPSKVLLKIILGRLKNRVDEIIAEEQAGLQSWSEYNGTNF